MGKVIREVFYADGETTERGKARFTFVKTLVFFLATIFASVWFFREHYTTEALAGQEWSLQFIAGLLFALIAIASLSYLWNQLQETRNKGGSLWW